MRCETTRWEEATGGQERQRASCDNGSMVGGGPPKEPHAQGESREADDANGEATARYCKDNWGGDGDDAEEARFVCG